MCCEAPLRLCVQVFLYNCRSHSEVSREQSVALGGRSDAAGVRVPVLSPQEVSRRRQLSGHRRRLPQTAHAQLIREPLVNINSDCIIIIKPAKNGRKEWTLADSNPVLLLWKPML